MASLYKPLQEGNESKLGAVIKTTKKFYKKIAIIFILYSISLSVLYPIIVKTNFSFWYVSSLCLIISMGTFIQYCFSLTFKNLLNADKKVYIVTITQSVLLILNILLVYISVKLFPNIHILKLISSILFVFQPVIFNYYVKKNYKIDYNSNYDNKLLKSRWNGFAINLAGFIHTNTDVLILTLFKPLSYVSIYSVYALVTSGLRTAISAISSGIKPTIGQLYVKKDYKDLNEKLDIYEFIIFTVVYFLFINAGLLITPFVMIYTKGINDANYYQPIFGVILIISEGIYLLKYPHLDLAYSANKFKEMSIPAYIEAIINIVVSLILVGKYGLIGIAVGTLVAMCYRTIFQVFFTYKMIKRPVSIFFKKIIIFTTIGVLDSLIAIFVLSKVEFNALSWIIHGIIYSIIILISYAIIFKCFYKKEISFLKKYLQR